MLIANIHANLQENSDLFDVWRTFLQHEWSIRVNLIEKCRLAKITLKSIHLFQDSKIKFKDIQNAKKSVETLNYQRSDFKKPLKQQKLSKYLKRFFQGPSKNIFKINYVSVYLWITDNMTIFFFLVFTIIIFRVFKSRVVFCSYGDM